MGQAMLETDLDVTFGWWAVGAWLVTIPLIAGIDTVRRPACGPPPEANSAPGDLTAAREDLALPGDANPSTTPRSPTHVAGFASISDAKSAIAKKQPPSEDLSLVDMGVSGAPLPSLALPGFFGGVHFPAGHRPLRALSCLRPDSSSPRSITSVGAGPKQVACQVRE